MEITPGEKPSQEITLEENEAKKTLDEEPLDTLHVKTSSTMSNQIYIESMISDVIKEQGVLVPLTSTLFKSIQTELSKYLIERLTKFSSTGEMKVKI